MDDREVTSITLRRQRQLQADPVIALADVLTRVLANHALKTRPEEQLLALELTVKAMLETLRHALGESGLNEILVEVEHRRVQYTVNWPEHDESPTVYDKFKDDQTAQVVLMRPTPVETDEKHK